MQTVDVAFAEEWSFDHGIMVPLNFLTPQYDLPVIPVNINCQGPPLTPLHRAWALAKHFVGRPISSPSAHCTRRYRRYLPLAGDARLRKDQRSLGSCAARALGAQ